MTYPQVDSLSSQFAAHLMQRGVAPEVIVPLLFEKSLWIIIAMLGVMKAGGAFALMDPSLPRQRLEYLCGNLQASVVVSSTQNAALAEELTNHVVLLGDKESEWRQGSQCSKQLDVAPSNALYVVFT